MLSQALFGSSTVPVLQQVLNFSQARHNVLAGNLANIDTPGYQVRDLSPQKFEAKLRGAIDARDRQATMPAAARYSQVQVDQVAQLSKELGGILHHDESNVSVEQQVAEIAKNQTRHNLALSIMNNQFRLLQAAISERA